MTSAAERRRRASWPSVASSWIATRPPRSLTRAKASRSPTRPRPRARRGGPVAVAVGPHPARRRRRSERHDVLAGRVGPRRSDLSRKTSSSSPARTAPSRTLGGFPAPSYPTSLAFSPDGKLLRDVRGRGQRRMRLSAVEDGREIRRLSPELLGQDSKAAGWLNWLANREGSLSSGANAAPTAGGEALLWPWDGGSPLPPVAASKGVVERGAATIRSCAWRHTPAAAASSFVPSWVPPNAPEREVASYDRGRRPPAAGQPARRPPRGPR